MLGLETGSSAVPVPLDVLERSKLVLPAGGASFKWRGRSKYVRRLRILSGSFDPGAIAGWKALTCRRATKLVQLNCQHCGKPFIRNSGTDGRANKYCGLDCYWSSRRIPKTCGWCKKEFIIPKSQNDRDPESPRFCSRRCMTLARRQGMAKEVTIRVCEVCGKRFNAAPWDIRNGRIRRHCSKICQRRRIIRECRTCKVPFESLASLNQIYCSVACYRRFQGESQLEAMVREELQFLRVNYEQEVQLGRWAIDFVIDHRIAVEVNGGYWHDSKKVKARDHKKKLEIRRAGYSYLRLTQTRSDAEMRLTILRGLTMVLFLGRREVLL